jgi:hypothetical protein
MIGARTEMAQQRMYATDGRIRNLLRVSRTGDARFVEAGIYAQFGGNEAYFFSDRNENGFYFNYIAFVPTSEFGKAMEIALWRNAGSWSIALTSYPFQGSFYWAGYSTPNWLDATTIRIGQMDASAYYSWANFTLWVKNQWKHGVHGTWNYQTRPDPMPGDYDQKVGPGFSGWNSKPSAGSGGIFWAYTPQ